MTKNKSYINHRLDEAIRRAGLNYKQFAKFIKVSPNCIYNVLYGYNSPSYNFIYKTCLALQLSPRDLFRTFFYDDEAQCHQPYLNDDLMNFLEEMSDDDNSIDSKDP